MFFRFPGALFRFPGAQLCFPGAFLCLRRVFDGLLGVLCRLFSVSRIF
jgi:hypothetical protein